jgi:REP element-mobilizing transposase RayT
MVLGYHVCFGAYGFWLPNDPRGSGSTFVGAKHLRPFGPATGLGERSRSVARREHDRRLRLEAKRHLKYPAVRFTGLQAKAAGDGFGDYVRRNGVVVWACSILPEHVHLVIARHRYDIESVIEQLKGAATRRLLKENLHPFGHLRKANGRPPSCWQRDAWFPFLWTPEDVRERIRYVENNPLKEGKPPQRWPFVVPYEG